MNDREAIRALAVALSTLASAIPTPTGREALAAAQAIAAEYGAPADPAERLPVKDKPVGAVRIPRRRR